MSPIRGFFFCIPCLVDCKIKQVMVTQLHTPFASSQLTSKKEVREYLKRETGEETGEYFDLTRDERTARYCEGE